MTQKITSDAYVSFSMFGLCFMFTMGILAIAASLTAEPILSCLDRRAGRHRYSHLEWRSNGVLQLQRLAYEGAGTGTWTRTTECVPLTKPDEYLALLDASDPGHTRLVAPVASSKVLSSRKTSSDADDGTHLEVVRGSAQDDDRSFKHLARQSSGGSPDEASGNSSSCTASVTVTPLPSSSSRPSSPCSQRTPSIVSGAEVEIQLQRGGQ